MLVQLQLLLHVYIFHKSLLHFQYYLHLLLQDYKKKILNFLLYQLV